MWSERERRERQLAGFADAAPSGGVLLEQAQPQLVETVTAPVEILQEASAATGGRMKVRGKLMEVDTRNQNGRVYKKAIVEREVQKLQEKIATRTAFAAADHPADGRTNFDNVVGLWEKVWVAGTEVFGEAVILNTDRGKNLQEIIGASKAVPLSARGFGNVRPGTWEGQPADLVEDGYQLVTFDFVLNSPGFVDAQATAVTEERGGGRQPLTEAQRREQRLAGLPVLAEGVRDAPLSPLVATLAAMIGSALNPGRTKDVEILSFGRDHVVVNVGGTCLKVPYRVDPQGGVTLGVPVPAVASPGLTGGMTEENRQRRLCGLPPLLEAVSDRWTAIPADLPVSSMCRTGIIPWETTVRILDGAPGHDIAVLAVSEALHDVEIGVLLRNVTAALEAKYPEEERDLTILEFLRDRVVYTVDAKVVEQAYTFTDTGVVTLGTVRALEMYVHPVLAAEEETRLAGVDVLSEEEQHYQARLAGVR